MRENAYDNKTALLQTVLKTVMDPPGGLNGFLYHTLPTDQTIHNRSLSKVCCDGFTCGIRNPCNNQHNILL